MASFPWGWSDRVLRRLDSAPGVSALRRRPAIARIRRAARYRTAVQESLRFFVREAARVAGVYVYRPVSSEMTIALRHNDHDAFVMDEVFGRGAYAPPAEVEGRLRRLARAPNVLDLGGHVGLFGVDLLSRLPDARLTSFEPDPANARILCATIARNGLAQRWRVVEAAACARNGPVRFAAGLGERSHLASPDEPAVDVTGVDALPSIAEADLLKLDIEGGEWELLADPRFVVARPGAIALEYHALGCPDPDPRASAVRILRGMGYAIRHPSEAPLSAEVGMLWAWLPNAPEVQGILGAEDVAK